MKQHLQRAECWPLLPRYSLLEERAVLPRSGRSGDHAGSRTAQAAIVQGKSSTIMAGAYPAEPPHSARQVRIAHHHFIDGTGTLPPFADGPHNQ